MILEVQYDLIAEAGFCSIFNGCDIWGADLGYIYICMYTKNICVEQMIVLVHNDTVLT